MKKFFFKFKIQTFEIINTINTICFHPLNKKKKVLALLKYIYLQFILYFINKSITVNWINNSKLKIEKTDKSLKANIFLGGVARI